MLYSDNSYLKEKTMQKLSEKNHYIGLLLLIISAMSFLILADSILSSGGGLSAERIPALSYFTIQSNIITLTWFICLVFYLFSNERLLKTAVHPNVTAIVTTYILVTGVIYWLVLVPIFFEAGADNSWLFTPKNIWNHTLTPFTSIVMFFFARENNPVPKPKPRLPLFFLYPAFYIAFGLYYALNGQYLYPMFNPELLGGWLFVGLSLLVIVLLFTILYLFMLKIFKNNGVSSRENSRHKTIKKQR